MHIKNKKMSVNLEFSFLKASANMDMVGCKKKKKSQILHLPELTHLQFSHQEMGFYFFTTWTYASLGICFGQQKVEEAK